LGYPATVQNAVEILFVRHALSTANATGIWQGQLDYPLSEEGEKQANLLAESLARKRDRISGIYSSPLSRASQTSRIVAERLRKTGNFCGEVVEMDGLKERRGGLLEGNTRDEQELKYPDLVHKFLNTTSDERWTLVGAETDKQLIERFSKEISAILSSQTSGGHPVIVTHGGCLKALLRSLLAPETLPAELQIPNTSITRLRWPDRVLQLAVTDHLDEGE